MWHWEETNSYAFGINSNGLMVGYLETADGMRAFIYGNGVATNIGTLGGTNSYAFRINKQSLRWRGHPSQPAHRDECFFLGLMVGLTNLNDLISSNSGWLLQEGRSI